MRASARAKYSSASTDDDSGRSHAARSFWREENRRWRQRFMLVCSTSSFLEAAAVLQLLERQQRCGSRELKAAARGSRLRDWILPRRRSRRRRRPAPGLDLAPTALLVAAACSGIGSCLGALLVGGVEVEGRGIDTGEAAHKQRTASQQPAPGLDLAPRRRCSGHALGVDQTSIAPISPTQVHEDLQPATNSAAWCQDSGDSSVPNPCMKPPSSDLGDWHSLGIFVLHFFLLLR